MVYYNIPRKIRELQSSFFKNSLRANYNIPRKIRELQLLTLMLLLLIIITYQEKLGNYNFVHVNKADDLL